MLDGDSIMPAETMVTLARTIEGNDTIGLIQVPPYEIGEATLFSAQRNFGMLMIPIMFAATYYFKIGRAFYLGHHAILRTETMTKDCSLPVLSRTKLFAEGKPMSHDVFEAALMEGAGWETYVLPQLVGFDQQVYNIKEWAIRENRWLVGSMNWLRLWRYKQLSFHGKSNVLFLSCLYSNAFLGVIGLCLSYYGSYYFFKNYLYSDLFLRHFQNLVMFSIAIFFFILLSPICLTLLYYHKSGRLRQLGGVVKVTFSYFLVYCLKSFLSIIKMFCLARFLFNWLKGKKIVWGAQDREYRGALSWEESFKFS
ncbi:MAG: hypothetical protein IJ934_03055 [Acetobacter sp.]|nr:hypothetical protein [Acetobacter sp.]